MLPAEQRHRYALEFISELYGMPRSQQIRHSVHVLSQAWALRAALAETGAAPTHEKTMTVKTTNRPFRCLLSHHLWRWASTEDGDRFEHCVRCGRDRTEKVGGLGSFGTLTRLLQSSANKARSGQRHQQR